MDQAAAVAHQGYRRTICPIQTQQGHPRRIQQRFSFQKCRMPAMGARDRFPVDFIFSWLILRHRVYDLNFKRILSFLLR